MDAKLDRIVDQLKELPLLRKQLGEHQGRLEELSNQIGLAAALVDEVKRDQAEARAAAGGGYDYKRLLKLKFPTFSGADHKVWLWRCETYFKLYEMPGELWVRVASMHMEGNAVYWMMNYERDHEQCGWGEFRQALEARYGAGDNQRYLRALRELKQEGTVREYRDRFEELLSHVMSYNPGMGMTFRVVMFIEGLREEISGAVRMYMPDTVDEAARLAILQEEVFDRAMQRAQRVGADYEG